MWPSSLSGAGAGTAAVWIASPPDAAPKRYEPMPFQATQFYDNPALAFSPDGKQLLLCVALDTRGETAWLLPSPPAKGSRAFTRGMPFSYTPQFAWMPDSRHVVFADSKTVRQATLYMADAGTGRHWPLLVQDRPAIQPTLSPDGTRVAYTSQLSHADVVAVPLGEGPIQTILGSTRDEERVDASSVSQQLVYVTNRRGVSEVWLKSLVEGWERPLLSPHDVLTNGEPAEQFLNPVFSPDGRRVAVSVKNRSGAQIYTFFVSGGTPVRATSSNDLELCPTWSPDGSWLAYSALVGSSPQLMKVRPGAGDAPAEVAKTYGEAAPVWSPTGEWIADHGRAGKLVLVDPDGKSPRVLPGDEGPVAWSRDGKTLYQIRAEPPALFAIDIATGKDRKLRDLPDLAPYSNGNPGLSAALTSDGKSIVYSVLRPRSEIWILSGIQKPRSWMIP
jgi:Tol biopolymer transport system component